MPFPFFPFRLKKTKPHQKSPPVETSKSVQQNTVRRHFFNERGFQTYGSFFNHWDGHITAGHVVKECGERIPPFSNGPVWSWPLGLDAALIGCKLPKTCPPDPVAGQSIKCIGYPAGSDHPATRNAIVYLERPGATDTWIARITTPDEPVVSGMSGGAVIGHAGIPIGILITRNSPADLNNDRDPDESFDFISLAGVWRAINKGESFV